MRNPSWILFGFLLAITAACGERPPAKNAPPNDSVPANSLSEARLTKDAGATADETSHDPTQPYLTKVGETPRAPGAGVSTTECDRVMDKYIELEIASNPQLKGVPPEIIEQAKAAAREQNGDIPCTATPAQYKCAMAAKTTEAWQRCLK